MKSVGAVLLLLLLLQWQPLEAAKILFIVGTPQHNNPGWLSPLYEALMGRGHAVTLVSTVPDPLLEGLEFTQLVNSYDLVQKHFTVGGVGSYQEQWGMKQMLIWYESLLGSCRAILLNSPSKLLKAEYDVILYDATYVLDCLLTLLPEYRMTPVMGLSSGKLTPDLLQLVKAENTISIPRVPHFVSEFSSDMSYWERIQNHIFYLGDSFIRWGVVLPVLDGMLRDGFAMPDVQLVLLNTHPVLDYVQNMPPNIIEVGGLHIRGESSPLPADLEAFVDRYTEGIVYINLEHIDLIRELTYSAIITMVKEFGQFGFILNMKNTRDEHQLFRLVNVRGVQVEGNLQQDILALSHIKAFITHGDSFGLQEAIYNAVPVIVQPLILEQLNNAKRIEERYLGIRIPFEELKADSFLNALSCLVRDGTYADALQQAQFSFRSRLVKPLDEAVWYVEQLAADPELFKHLQHPRSQEHNYFVSHSFDVLVWPLLFTIIFIINVVLLLMPKDSNLSVKILKMNKGNDKLAAVKKDGEDEDDKPMDNHSELFEKMDMEEEEECNAAEDKKLD